MKKHFYLFLGLMAVCILSQAQIKPGATLLGGNIAFSTQSTLFSNPPGQSNSDKLSSFTLNPYFGKAVKQDLVVGFDLLYQHDKTENTFAYIGTSNSYGAGVFIRKYKYLGSHFYLFGQTRLGGAYNSGKSLNPGGDPSETDTKGYSIGLSFYPGISYAVNEKWQLEAAFPNLAYLNYGHTKETNQPEPNTNDFTENSFNVGSSLSAYQISIGVSFLLNR